MELAKVAVWVRLLTEAAKASGISLDLRELILFECFENSGGRGSLQM
jgi:hypothetical protein